MVLFIMIPCHVISVAFSGLFMPEGAGMDAEGSGFNNRAGRDYSHLRQKSLFKVTGAQAGLTATPRLGVTGLPATHISRYLQVKILVSSSQTLSETPDKALA